MKTKITTSDIYFVAALVTTGAKIDSVDRSDPRHIRFDVSQPNGTYSFTSENLPVGGSISAHLVGLEQYETMWANAEMVVNAVAYKNAIQQVKTLIHST
jgi:hypothetical protein